MDLRADWKTAALAALAALAVGVVGVLLLGGAATVAGILHGDQKHLHGDLLVSFAAGLVAALLAVPVVRRVVRRRAGVLLGLTPLVVTALMAGVFLASPISLPLYLMAWVACARFAQGTATLPEPGRV
jgi:hypothetical protein